MHYSSSRGRRLAWAPRRLASMTSLSRTIRRARLVRTAASNLFYSNERRSNTGENSTPGSFYASVGLKNARRSADTRRNAVEPSSPAERANESARCVQSKESATCAQRPKGAIQDRAKESAIRRAKRTEQTSLSERQARSRQAAFNRP